jgi:hypothetical protein
MPSSAILRHVAVVRTDVSEERIASINSVTRVGELIATLAVTSNRTTLCTVLSRQVSCMLYCPIYKNVLYTVVSCVFGL